MKNRTRIISISILTSAGIVVIPFLCFSIATKKWAQSEACGSNMKAVGLAGRLWANDHVELMPTNFMCMSNEVVTPKVLHCPADHERPRVSTWDEFSEENSSYLMVSPGAKEGTTNVVFIRCRIHGHLGFVDGSVFNASRTKVVGKH